LEGLGGGSFGASNSGDVMMMATVAFPFGANGDSKKLKLAKCR
jgi:hypothetical protein